MQLSGAQLKALREALIAAFPDESDLEEMVLDELDERLNTIAQGKEYRTTVRKFVKWAEAQERLREVIIGASRVNPGNSNLRAFISESFDVLLEPPDLLPQELTTALLLILRPIQSFQAVTQCCRLTLPGAETHRLQTLKDIENAQLSVDVRWLRVLELLFYDYPQQAEIPSVVLFANHLHQQIGLSSKSLNELTEWLSKVAAQCNYQLPQQAAPRQELFAQAGTVQGYLPIIVSPSKLNKEQFLVHGFLIIKASKQDDLFIPIEDLSGSSLEQAEENGEISQKGATCTIVELQEQVPLWVHRAKEALIARSRELACSYELTIEFFLPYEQLAMAVDLWKVKAVIARREKFEPIGKRHRIAVRSFDRLVEPDLFNALTQTWQQAELFLSHQPNLEEIRVKCEGVSQTTFGRSRKLIPRWRQCLALKLTCGIPKRIEEQEELFLALLEAGVPLALWTRQGELMNVSVDQEFDQLLVLECLCNLDKLLEQIRQKRESAHFEDNPCEHLGYHLGILCDEPKRLRRLNQFIEENKFLWRSA